MKIISISEVDSLIGKKLAFAHIVPYGETILLVMEDGTAAAVSQKSDEDGDFFTTEFLNDWKTMKYIAQDTKLRHQLASAGLFDLEAYEAEQKAKREAEARQRVIDNEARDRATYERLKLRFEGPQSSAV